jgi:hypothetical protein
MYFLKKLGLVEDNSDATAAESPPSTPPRPAAPAVSRRAILLSDAVKTTPGKDGVEETASPPVQRPCIEAVEVIVSSILFISVCDTLPQVSLMLKIRVPDDPSNKFALLLRNVLSVGPVRIM